MHENESNYCSLSNVDEMLTEFGLDDKKVLAWLKEQILLFEIDPQINWWIDRSSQEKGFVSIMNKRKMMVVEGNGIEWRSAYVIDFKTGMWASLYRDKRGWVRKKTIRTLNYRP